MRVFVAGATGVIGRRLVPALIAAGHEVAGLTRHESKTNVLAAAGATPIVCDVYDPELTEQVARFRPDVVVHQVTHLPSSSSLWLPFSLRGLNKARKQGTDALVAAARAAETPRLIAQSAAFALPSIAQKAVDHLEEVTLSYPGLVLRYGYFWGPDTWYPHGTKRRPAVHIDHAVARTVDLVNADPGVYEVTDPD